MTTVKDKLIESLSEELKRLHKSYEETLKERKPAFDFGTDKGVLILSQIIEINEHLLTLSKGSHDK